MEYLDKTGLAHLITKIKQNTSNGGTGNVSSDVIHSIMVVDELPDTEVEGVLYLVKNSISTVTNLYPSQIETSVTDGVTITFKGKNVIADGSNDTVSIWATTNNFAMDLEANKNYYLQFTQESGSMDDSNRIINSDGIITSIFLIGYDSSGNATNLINEVERPASSIYDKYSFKPTQEFVSYVLRFQVKKYITCDNWNLSIVIAEESNSSTIDTVNIMPNLVSYDVTSNGVSFVCTGSDTNITLNGTASSSEERPLEPFNANLVPNKTYKFRYEIIGGSVDGSAHDNEVADIRLRGYTSDGTIDNLVSNSWVQTNTSEEYEFTFATEYSQFAISIRQKSNTIYENLVVKFSIFEV